MAMAALTHHSQQNDTYEHGGQPMMGQYKRDSRLNQNNNNQPGGTSYANKMASKNNMI